MTWRLIKNLIKGHIQYSTVMVCFYEKDYTFNRLQIYMTESQSMIKEASWLSIKVKGMFLDFAFWYLDLQTA